MTDTTNNLMNLINNPEESNQAICDCVVDYLTDNGFQEDEVLDDYRGFRLIDPEGQEHIGKSYLFLLTPRIADSKFVRNSKNEVMDYAAFCDGNNDVPESIKIYEGSEAIRTLVRTMEIREAIADAEVKGLYEVAEHKSCPLD
jgi:hypothetical protein